MKRAAGSNPAPSAKNGVCYMMTVSGHHDPCRTARSTAQRWDTCLFPYFAIRYCIQQATRLILHEREGCNIAVF